jgi:hypothetical protein
MAQGEFTKEEAHATIKAVEELHAALPKGRRADFIGHLNDIYLFLQAAEEVAPEKTAQLGKTDGS